MSRARDILNEKKNKAATANNSGSLARQILDEKKSGYEKTAQRDISSAAPKEVTRNTSYAPEASWNKTTAPASSAVTEKPSYTKSIDADDLTSEELISAYERYKAEQAEAAVKREAAAKAMSSAAGTALNKILDVASHVSISTPQTEAMAPVWKARNEAKQDEKARRISEYDNLAASPDYAENSKYVAGSGNTLYDYINGDEQAKQKQALLDTYSKADSSYVEQMTPQERSTYNYLFNTRGQQAAKQYLNDISAGLNEKQRAVREAAAVKYANEHPVLASAQTVATSPMRAASYAGQVTDYLIDGQIDSNASYNRYSYESSAMRNAVSQKVEQTWGPVGTFLYQTGMSMGDFLTNAFITGGLSGGGQAAEALSLGIMGSGAAADSVIEAKTRGLSDDQAFTIGTIAGLAEIVTERYSLEALLDKTTLEQTVKGYLLKNVLAEGSEEVASDIINLFGDVMVAKDKSEWKQAISEYKAQGYTEAEAFGMAFADEAKQLGVSFLGGALSGGVMAGGSIGLNIGNDVYGIRSTGEYQALVDEGKASAEGTRANRLAAQYQDVLDNTGKLSNMQTLQQYLANRNAIAAEEMAKARSIENKPVATDLSEAKTAPSINVSTEENVRSNRLSEAQESLAAKVAKTAAEVRNTLGNMGRKVHDAVYNRGDNPGTYTKSFTNVYQAAKEGKPIPATTLNQAQINSAIYAAQEDIKAEGIRNGEEVYLRNGSERYDGKNTGGEVRVLEENAGRDSSGQIQAKPRDAQAVSLKASKVASTAELGIGNGSTTDRVWIVDNGSETAAMKEARNIARESGLRVTFYVGGYLNVGRSSNIRGCIIGDRVFIKADDPHFTSAQIMKHEETHRLIKEGKVDLSEVREKLNASVPGGTEEAISRYEMAYAGSDMTADEIFEEIVCDARADMNIFQGIDTIAPVHQEYNESVQKATEIKEANQARAPDKGDIKFSRRTVGGKEIAWIENSGMTSKQLDDLSYISKFIGQHIGEVYTIIESGQPVYIGKDIPREYTHSKYTNEIRKNDRSVFRAKNKAASELGTLIEVATNRRWETVKHPQNKDAKYGVYRYDTTFAFPVKDSAGKTVRVKAYDADLVIVNSSDGNKYLYDVVNIKENTPVTMVLTNRETRSAAAKATATRGNASGKSVTDKSAKSNSESSDAKFSMVAPVEESGDLVALHNLSAEKLEKALKLGGFPMPSIAVTKSSIPHTNFGDITLVMNKSTVDPKASRKNTVYSADAWTPTFPSTEYEVNEKVASKLRSKYYDLYNKFGNEATRPLYAWANYADDELNRVGGVEKVISQAQDDTDMMKLYLMDQGMDVPSPITEENVKRMDEGTIRFYDHFVNALGEDAFKELSSQEGKSIPQVRREWWAAHGEAFENAYREYMSDLGFTDEEMENVLNNETVASQTRKALEMRNYILHGPETRTVTENISATKDAIKAAVDKEAYSKWLHGMFDGLEKSSGIYNGRDRFTASGDRRSFSATHDPVTLENIAKIMSKQNEGNSRNVDGFYGIKSLRAGMAERFSSIERMHELEGRLQHLTEEEATQISDALSNRMTDIFQKIYDSKTHSPYDNSFIEMDAIGDMVMEATETRPITIDAIVKAFKGSGYKVGNELAAQLRDLLFDVSQMPVNIFEAKPERAVRFNEVLAAIVPEGTDSVLIESLKNSGVENVMEYMKGDDADRLAKVNSVEDAKFSRAVSAEELKERFDMTEEDAALAADAIADLQSVTLASPRKSYKASDGIQIEMDFAKMLDPRKLRTSFDAFTRELIYDGGVTFVGRTFNDVNEMAAAANVFRDPRFETVRYYFLDKDNKVVMNTGFATRLPAEAQIANGTTNGEVWANLGQLFEKARDAGAVKFYQSHNHPSGQIRPSLADYQSSDSIRRVATGYGLECAGYFIIDHQKYSVLDLDKRQHTEHDYSEGTKDPLLERKYSPIRRSSDLAKAAINATHSPHSVVFVYASAQLDINGLQTFTEEELKATDMTQYLHDEGLAFGAQEIFAVGFDIGDDTKNLLQDLYERKIIGDATYGTGYTYRDMGMRQSRGKRARKGGYVYRGQEHFSETRFSQAPTNPEMQQLREDNSDLRRRMFEYNDIKAELKKQTARAERAEGQLKLTKQPTIRRADVEKLARSAVKSVQSTVDTKTVADKMEALANKIVRSETLDYDEIKAAAVDISRDIIQNSRELVNGEELDTYKGIKDYLKGKKFYFDNFARYDQNLPGYLKGTPRTSEGEIGDYQNFKRHNQQRFRLTNDPDGAVQIDDAWNEMREMFGEAFFPESINTVPDMVLHISELLDSMEPVYENPFDYNMAEAIEWQANDILDGLIDETVRQTAPTYADRMERKLKKQAYDYSKRLKAVREQRDQKIERLKEHYEEVAQAKRARKEDSAARTRLLNIAKRLNNMKLDRVNKALLNQYIGDLDLVAKGITGKSIEELTALRDWYEGERENNRDFIPDSNIEKKISRLEKKHIADMTQEEVADLTEVLLYMENEIRTQRKLIDSEERRDIYLAGAETIGDIENSKGKRGAISEYIINETLSPERAARMFTGYRDRSPLQIAVKELAAGQRKMQDYVMRANKRFTEWTNDKALVKKLTGKKADEITITGISKGEPVSVKITPAMRMSLYLHSLNEQNMKHIDKGGVTVPDMQLYKAGKLTEAYGKGTTITLSPSQIRDIAAGMSPQERAFARAAHDYFNTMSRDEINDTSEKLKGYSLAAVDNYYPIDTNKNFIKKEFDSIARDGSIEGMGFTKERNDSSKPIMLYDMTDVLNKSISQHSKYVGLAIPVRNFNKLWGVVTGAEYADGEWTSYDDSVQAAMSRKWGAEGKEYIERMMSDLQNPGKSSDAFSKILSKTRSNYAGAVLEINPSVAIKQTASYPSAAAVVGFKPLMKALADTGKVNLDLVAKYTPLLWYRSQGYSTQELGELTSRKGNLPKMLNWIQGMDVATTTKLWKAAEYYVKDTSLTKQGTDAYYKQVAEVYNRIIEETQPNYTVMQRPQLLRSENELVKAFNMFKTQPFQNFNILYDSIENMNAKRTAWQNTGTDVAKAAYDDARKKAVWAVGSQLAASFVFALMQYAWDAFRGKDDKYKDDEGEITFESWAKKMGLNMLTNGAGMVPFGGVALESFEYGTDKILEELGHEALFDQAFYGLEVSFTDTFNDILKGTWGTAAKIVRLANDRDSYEKADWEALIRSSINTAETWGQLGGVPLANARKTLEAVTLQTLKASMGKYIGGYYAMRITTDPAKYPGDYYDLLYKAYTSDEAAYNELYDLMVSDDTLGAGFSEEKIRNAIESRMKKEQGVSSVSDLDSRYLSPSQQTSYDKELKKLQSSEIWRGATQQQKENTEGRLYELTTGSSSGQKMQEKISGGKEYGLNDTNYLLYLLALEMVDQPNKSGNLGTYTVGEKKDAADMANLTQAAYEYLK